MEAFRWRRDQKAALAGAYHCGDAAAGGEEQECYPELLLDVADDEADQPKDDDEDLEGALTIKLPLKVLRGRCR